MNTSVNELIGQGAPSVLVDDEMIETAEGTELEVETGDDADGDLQIKKQFFPPAELEAANGVLAQLEEKGIKPIFNFDPSGEFPSTTHGLLIAPINKRVPDGDTGEMKTIAIGCLAAAVPTVAAILAHGEAGKVFIDQAVEKVLFATVANAVRPRDGATPAGKAPYTIEEFITPRRGNDELQAYGKISKMFVKGLKDKGLKRMTAGLLKDCVSCAENANQFFPNIPQDTWVKLLEMMATKAADRKLPTAIFLDWTASRDNATGIGDVDGLDLDGLFS